MFNEATGIAIATGTIGLIIGSLVTWLVTMWYARTSDEHQAERDRVQAERVVELESELARMGKRLAVLNTRLAIDGRSEDRAAVDVLTRNLSRARQIVESEESFLLPDVLQELKNCVKRADNVMAVLAMDL